ncbi:MAG: hypothetical protein Q7J78_03310 [Clostridiales bacterium]|nr:hypothetical protein [Clostridiales bacterium]
MKIEISEVFKPMLESMIDGAYIKSISEALNMHLLKTLKPVKVEKKPGTKGEPAQPHPGT